MSAASVSIVIPTYNRAHLVRRAIETALAQTVPCEVVLVDHGSSDETNEVAADYADLVYVRKDEDLGPFVAWIDGAITATGRWIHYTFDDDWLEPEFVERCLDETSDDVGVVVTNASIVFPDRAERMLNPEQSQLKSGDAQDLLRYLMATSLTISPGCALFRRRDVVDALMTNPVVRRTPFHGAGPDLMMFLHVLLRYPRFAFVSDQLASFRAHDGSLTIDALADPTKSAQLRAAYREYKQFVMEAAQRA